MSIVWIQMPGFNDNESTAAKIAGTIVDPRVRHFFDPFPRHRAGREFAEGVINKGAGPAWDIYFFYDKDAQWKDGPPSPTDWMHQLGGGRRADPKHFHAGENLVTRLHEVMHEVTGDRCAEDE